MKILNLDLERNYEQTLFPLVQRYAAAWIKTASVTPLGRRLSLDELSDNNGALGVIDLDVLSELKELQQPGQSDFVTELIDLFLNDTASQLTILRAAISSNDVPEVRRVAHLMKGSSANIGATRLAELYRELETKEPGTLVTGSDGLTLLVRLEDELHHVSEVLKAQRRECETVIQ